MSYYKSSGPHQMEALILLSGSFDTKKLSLSEMAGTRGRQHTEGDTSVLVTHPDDC